MYCLALPEMITLDLFNNDYANYFDYLYYNIFRRDLFNMKVIYCGKKVSLKSMPRSDDGKENSYYHLTCKDYNGVRERQPDLKRCERLNWIKPALETNHQSECEKNCFLVYKTWYKNRVRTNLLNPIDRYQIVLEERDSYWLMITAFYIDYDNRIKKQLKKYRNFTETREPV